MIMLNNDLLFVISLYLERNRNFILTDKETYSICKFKLYKFIKIQRWFKKSIYEMYV